MKPANSLTVLVVVLLYILNVAALAQNSTETGLVDLRRRPDRHHRPNHRPDHHRPDHRPNHRPDHRGNRGPHRPTPNFRPGNRHETSATPRDHRGHGPAPTPRPGHGKDHGGRGNRPPGGGPRHRTTTTTTTPKPKPRPKITERRTTTTTKRPTEAPAPAIAPPTSSPTWVLVSTQSSNDPVADASPGLVDPNGSPTATPTPTSQNSGQDNSTPTGSIVPGVSDGNFALALGLSVGGVAAIGLAGYTVQRRRENARRAENRDANADGAQPGVSTRWRHQSFLRKVEAVVARLPSDGRSSRSSAKSKQSRGSGGTTLNVASPSMASQVLDYQNAAGVSGSAADQMEEVQLR